MRTNELRIDRRSVLRGLSWTGLSLLGFFRGGRKLLADDAKLDDRPGKVTKLSAEELGKFSKLEGESETFGVTLPNGERHLFRFSAGEKGGALIESIGPKNEKHKVSIAEDDSPLRHLERKQSDTPEPKPDDKPDNKSKSQSNFWACWASTFVNMVGQAIWGSLQNNFISCWNTANKKKKLWQKIASFWGCILKLPYATYAIQALFACK